MHLFPDLFRYFLLFTLSSNYIEPKTIYYEGTLEDRGYDISTCDMTKECNEEGICIQGNLKPNCLCFEQFFTGKQCDIVAGYCDAVDEEDYGRCDTFGTKNCIGTFGNEYCDCFSKKMDRKGASGRYCDKKEYFEWRK